MHKTFGTGDNHIGKKVALMLAISIILLFLIILGAVIYSGTQNAEARRRWEEIEEKVPMQEELQEENQETAEDLPDTAETASEILAKEDSTEDGGINGGAEACLADLGIHPLYAAFLRNEISVPNPYVSESELSFFDDRDYAQEEHTFEYASKSFSLVDVNNDGVSELIFKIYESPDELMYILGIQGDQLVCYDVQETHTSRMSFGIFDNGIVVWSQGHDGAETIYYTYDEDGSPQELLHFVWEDTGADTGLYYDYYYMDGDETLQCRLQSNEEYEALISPYAGEEPEWFYCDSFADIPVE